VSGLTPLFAVLVALSNGQKDEFPASWALSESDVMRALEYFVEHEGRRPPFVQWHDDASRRPIRPPYAFPPRRAVEP
jgi:hypothetical protein